MPEINMNLEPEKRDLHSLDIADVKQQELLRLFPEERTKGGKIDSEWLNAALGGHGLHRR